MNLSALLLPLCGGMRVVVRIPRAERPITSGWVGSNAFAGGTVKLPAKVKRNQAEIPSEVTTAM